MLKGNTFRIYPNEEQKKSLERHFGASRFIYNKLLEVKKEFYKKFKITISKIQLKEYIQILKDCHPWLRDVYAHSLLFPNDNLDKAYTNFLKKRAGHPQRKKKKDNILSYQMSDSYQINHSTSKIYLSKVGWVKIKMHRELFNKELFNTCLNITNVNGEPILKHVENITFLRTLTVSRTPTRKYHVSILTEDQNDTPTTERYSDILGIDVGIKTFAACSDGTKINNPKFLKNSLKKLKCLQKRVSRKIIGSKNRNKSGIRLAKLHEKISNQRHDFQHKLSLKLVSENQAIAIETLNIKGMIKNHKLAQAIGDSAWYSFVQKLEYKAKWYGKSLFKIGMFEPSSKTCNVCGYKLKELSLKEREWECPSCNTLHDRDINAAINIKNFVTVGTTGRAYGSMNDGSRDEVGSLNALA
jgi:putative transposase